MALHNMGRYEEAIVPLRKVRSAEGDPSYEVCNLLGACLIKTGESAEAADLFEAATRQQPDNAEGWANLSVALNALGEHGRASECADRAVALHPKSQTALGALGAAQFGEGRLAEAIESYRMGVALPGPSVPMLLSFATALLNSGLNEEAAEQLERAIKLDERNLIARWTLVVAQLKGIYGSTAEIHESRAAFAKGLAEIEEWHRGAAPIANAFNAVGAIQPFYIAYQPFNNRELLSRYGTLCATWMASLPGAASAAQECAARVQAGGGDRIRVGIASAHINEHSVWNAITCGWVTHMDTARFELSLFHLGRMPGMRADADEQTENARRLVAHFEDRPTTLAAWVQAIRDRQLDVLIYPDIGMTPMTVQLAALRLAPVQAASWGHPETTGLPTMDLYISGEALEPAGASANYSERLIALPNLGVHVEPLEPKIEIPDLGLLGLPENEPLLLCPGTPFKYTPLFDQVWANIARQLKKRLFKKNSGGRLVFFRSRSDSMDRLLESRLRAAFAAASIDFDSHASIIRPLARPRYFGLMSRSALLLDTLGFSGFNTAIQAVECGLPVLAYEGEFMRGRLASAIMRTLDLPELVAATPAQFVQRAVELAADGAQRRDLSARIAERRHVLFRDLATVRALETQLADAVARARMRPAG
jgi:predicted O-linked N-acetylglucosamine transferase (SPINDLY family)